MYRYSNSQAEMIEEIKVKRELMIKSANTFGFTSDETIKYSQELDELINKYHRMMGQAAEPDEEVKFAIKKSIMIWPKALV
ncbi:aspartyl-phosphate phosphatase Spo0E family protein [Neobacillus sp. OS1-32]|uniref:Aspartyl-phosphate phosphatase Spo0E family protein n=1 Tax=Neobacillus paridis TaxID=2803862 RepID=A0ABS1TMK1_9BACI|nr:MULTISPECIES: aspartyl-phosphate phosphatase Spo0E family protein [Neobacillus]MBL4952472.1 aspartyl-phosphate phosphatase Spo0E family protein [Neobacillus paridis]WML32002.1 aspartyl-phosphate phosphatase Spo0E family protein [Neobacillus sp. OS1-32]